MEGQRQYGLGGNSGVSKDVKGRIKKDEGGMCLPLLRLT